MKNVVLIVLVLSVILAGCQLVLENVFLVRGTVVDDNTDQPILSVEIGIPGYQYAELTNSAGDYAMEIPDGTWGLVFQKDGYEAKSEQVTVGEDAPRIELITRLVPIPKGDDWIVGNWVNITDDSISWPETNVLELREDTTVDHWEYYNLTESFEDGNWSMEGETLTIFGMDLEIEKISDDQFNVPMMSATMVRKGTEPNIFSQTETELTAGAWTEGSILEEQLQLYSFPASAGDYIISWDDSGDGSGGYTGDINVYPYAADQETCLFFPPPGEEWEDDGFTTPRPITLAVEQTIFIIVEGDEQEGSFRIRINP